VQEGVARPLVHQRGVAAREFGDVGWNVDPEALSAFIRYGFVPAPLSIYRGIDKLPAGHWVSFDLTKLQPGHFPAARRYWDSKGVAERAAAEPFAGDLDAAADELDRRLTRSVEQLTEKVANLQPKLAE